jgi:cytochrome b561
MQTYPKIIKIIHWITLILICGSLSSSFFMYKLDGTLNMDIINAHAINGTIILLLTLTRFIYRAKYGVPATTGNNSYQITIARFVHKSFYVVIFCIALLGIISFTAKKLLIINNNSKEFFISNFKINLLQIAEISGALHSLFVFIFLILLSLHILGFIYHQFIIKSNIIKKIWFIS